MYNIHIGDDMRFIKDKSKRMIEIEEEHNIMIEELLRKKYVDDGESVHLISKSLGISYVTVIKWLELAGIYSRKLDI